MIVTLTALVVAILLQIYPVAQQVNPLLPASVMLIMAIPFLIIFPLGIMLSWIPLQKAESNLTPRVFELFYHDKPIRLAGGIIVLFPLFSIILATVLVYSHYDHAIFLGIWVVLFGIALDCLRYYARRVIRYLNPFQVAQLFSNQVAVAIRNNHEVNLCRWIDALSEIAIKGIQRNNHALCNLALDELENAGQLFLEASKSIAHPEVDKETKLLGTSDKVSYMMFFIYQRLDMMFNKAIQEHLETVCSHIITILGKLSVSAAKFDMTLASAPLRFLGKCASRAQEAGFEEAPITASCTLYLVAKTILTEINVQYYEIKDPFLSIINGMEVLAKQEFRRNKQININSLIQPFNDLKALFDQPQIKEHQDVPVIIVNIDRVIGEFRALESVMNAMPKIPEVEG